MGEKPLSAMNAEERKAYARELRESIEKREKSGFIKTEAAYRVLVDNKWKEKKYTVYGPEGFAEKIEGYFKYIANTEIGQKGLKAFAKTDRNLYVVYDESLLHTSKIPDPFARHAGKEASLILFNPSKALIDRMSMTFYMLDKPYKSFSPEEGLDKRKFTHEFGHVLQHAGIAPPYYTRNAGWQPDFDSEAQRHHEGDAVRWANDVAVAQGAKHFRKFYYSVFSPGRIQVDSPQRIIDRSEENVIRYKELKNKKEYLTLEQIRSIKPENGRPYTLKPDAEGILVRAEKPSGEYAIRRLYHYRDVDRQYYLKSVIPFVREPLHKEENIRQDFYQRHMEIVKQAQKKEREQSRPAEKNQPEVGP